MEDFKNYSEMFSAATKFERPFVYQEKMAEDDILPSLVSVPTGLGKTAAVILAWLWRRRFADESVREQTPRRLVYCLPMRVLVEQTRDCAKKWLGNIDLLAKNAPEEHLPDEVAVHVLMGGDMEMDWDNWPDRDQILIGTQDMLLSRALNRGYAMSRFRWPVQFGLLNNDCLWVMDEVQLMGNGLATTAQLQAFRRKLGTMSKSQSIWMSATMRPEWLETVDFEKEKDSVGKSEIDERDKNIPDLKRRFEAVKPIEKAEFTASTDGKVEADFLIEKHEPQTRTLCVVNTVKRAQKVYKALKKKKQSADIVLLHSRFRQPDRARHLTRLLDKPGKSGTIAVCTQVVEAGVDVSSKLLVTDLAPWSSLVQRFGRCNRKGEFNEKRDARAVWMEPPDLNDDKKLKAAPYSPDELRYSAGRLVELADAGPKSLPEFTEPITYNHVIRRKDMVELFDTTPDLAGADIDVSRFIRETDENSVQVFWREFEGKEPGEGEEAPARDELCSVPINDIDIKKPSAWRWDHLEKKWIRPANVFPGLVLMLSSEQGGYSVEAGWNGKEKKTEPMHVERLEPEGNDDDPHVSGRSWQTIREHTDEVVFALEGLIENAELKDSEIFEALLLAARWHDAGKAHHVFQNAVPKENAPENNVFWGKSKEQMKHYERPGFRHELASAIAMLQNGQSDLAAYLAASHHGKVRMSIRSLPHEKHPENDTQGRFARGVWDGDALRGVYLGGGVSCAATMLDLSYMELGDGPRGLSWLARNIALREKFGPFRLAYMEALMRVADWRGSQAKGVRDE